jgi:hypothetical protein
MSALALPALQAAFRAVCLGGDAPELSALVDGEGIAGDARLRIYRNHVFHSLSTALGATFSTAHALVGDAFFRRLARDYIAARPPAVPVLSEYGADFADFIAGHERTRELVYLADAVRLDWALNRAYSREPGEPLTAERLASIPPLAVERLRLRLRDGVSLLTSPYPLDSIWAASRPGASETVDLASGGVALVVFPRDDDAAFARLSRGEWTLLDACDGETSLTEAFERAVNADAAFDFAATLPKFLGLSLLAAP